MPLWLTAAGAPPGLPPAPGTAPRVLHDVYLHRIDSQQDHISQRIADALDADASNRLSSQWVKAIGYAYRRLHP